MTEFRRDPPLRAVLVEDRRATLEMYRQWVDDLGFRTAAYTDPVAFLDEAPEADVVIADLSFAHFEASGLDVLLSTHRRSPDTALMILTNGDQAVSDLLRICWEALPVRAAVSKDALQPEFAEAMAACFDPAAHDFVDRELRPWLPTSRDPGRSSAAFGEICQHAGQLRTLLTLADFEDSPTKPELARAAGLSANTVNNYCRDVIFQLGLRGFEVADFAQLHRFVRLTRPLLAQFERSST